MSTPGTYISVSVTALCQLYLLILFYPTMIYYLMEGRSMHDEIIRFLYITRCQGVLFQCIYLFNLYSYAFIKCAKGIGTGSFVVVVVVVDLFPQFFLSMKIPGTIKPF